jgi:hypothetical protein
MFKNHEINTVYASMLNYVLFILWAFLLEILFYFSSFIGNLKNDSRKKYFKRLVFHVFDTFRKICIKSR